LVIKAAPKSSHLLKWVYQLSIAACINLHPLVTLNTAIPGTFTLTPSPAMRDAITRDYAAMSGMVFGEIAQLDAVLASAERFEQIVNRAATVAPLALKWFNKEEPR